MIYGIFVLVLMQNHIPIQWDMLVEPAVQQELRLQPDVVKKVKLVWTKAEAELERQRKSQRPVARAISTRGWTLEIALPELRRVGEGLDPQRKRRAREISIQQWRTSPLDYPGVEYELQVDPAKGNEIRKHRESIIAKYIVVISRYVNKHQIPLMQSKGGQRIPLETPGLRKIEAQRDAEIWRSLRHDLTKQQNIRLTELLGKPFKR